MSIKTITKFAFFVIPLLFGASCSTISFGGAEHAEIGPENGGFEKAEVISRIASKEINESSGLAVSKCQPDVFWKHNDSGDGPFIYAINSKGESLGTFRIPNVKNTDWEDMSAVKDANGECFLYIGEIGDNDRKRDVHEIYLLREPTVLNKVSLSTRDAPEITDQAETIHFRYPDTRHNAEALLVEPMTQKIYVVTKQFSGPASVYVLLPDFGNTGVQVAVKTGEVSLPASPVGLVTGGSISPDGKHLVLCDYYAGYEFILPTEANEFEEIWKQQPVAFDLGPRKVGESVAFGDDSNSIFATTEGLNAPLIRVRRGAK
jgi:hypothetical protein